MNLSRARLYLCAPAQLGNARLAELIPELVSAGVDIVQLREKEMEGGDLLRAGAPILEACRAAGVPFVVNDRPDVAFALGADGVHLGTNDLPLLIGRTILPTGIVGLSTHSDSQVDWAVAQRPDYFATGPVNSTPTKPGRPGTGLDLIRYAANNSQGIPWFVTGGMDESTIPAVSQAGARRFVVVRAITEAPDPAAAAAAIRQTIDEVPL